MIYPFFHFIIFIVEVISLLIYLWNIKMEIIQKSVYHISIKVTAGEVVDTEMRSVEGYPPAKYLLTYFEGTGTLEVSQDKNVWIDTEVQSGELFPITTTLPRYLRITGPDGEKTVHLTTI